jgi:hypothetical protein
LIYATGAERARLQQEIDAYDAAIRGGAPTPDSVAAQNNYNATNMGAANTAAAANRAMMAQAAQAEAEGRKEEARIRAQGYVDAAKEKAKAGGGSAEPVDESKLDPSLLGGSTQKGRTESTSVAPAAPLPPSNLDQYGGMAKGIGRHNQNTKGVPADPQRVGFTDRVVPDRANAVTGNDTPPAERPQPASQPTQTATVDVQTPDPLPPTPAPAPRRGGSMSYTDSSGNRATVTTSPEGQDTKAFYAPTGKQVSEQQFGDARKTNQAQWEQKRERDLMAKNINDMTADEYQQYLRVRMRRGDMRSTTEQRNDNRDAVLRGETSVTDTRTGNALPVGRGPVSAADQMNMTSDEQRAYAGRVNSNYADAAAARTAELDGQVAAATAQVPGRVAANTAAINANVPQAAVNTTALPQNAPMPLPVAAPSVAPIVSTVPLPPNSTNASTPAVQSTQAGRQFMRQATAVPRLLNPTPTVPSMYATPAAQPPVGGVGQTSKPMSGRVDPKQFVASPDGTFTHPGVPGVRYRKVQGGFQRI